MTNLIFSFLSLFIFLYHKLTASYVKRGKIREYYTALWVSDTIFVFCGTAIAFTLYHYEFSPIFSARNLILAILFLVISTIFLLLTPSGFLLFRKTKPYSPEELIGAEYRFNETAVFIRNLFLTLLFLLPVFLSLPKLFPQYFYFLERWQTGELCSGFCMIMFLLLFPLCFRQAAFWLRNLSHSPSEVEKRLLKKIRVEAYYKGRNTLI